MSQLTWDDTGERLFEAGIDRGVLYVDGQGVPWNGLIAVERSAVGGDITPRHYDGVRYHNQAANEEFQGKIEAFTYPDEFAVCDGTVEADHGLFMTHQTKKEFGLCYRTQVGDDVSGLDRSYKIHLIYNAKASPTKQKHESLNDKIDPFNFAWDIVTRPPEFVGYKPTAYFVIDSRKAPEEVLEELEGILYGTDQDDPRLPSAAELINMFTTYDASYFDAGWLTETYYATIDAGDISETYTDTIDGGSP